MHDRAINFFSIDRNSNLVIYFIARVAACECSDPKGAPTGLGLGSTPRAPLIVIDMEKVYIGIDPGSQGVITALYPDGGIDFCHIPDVTTEGICVFIRRMQSRACGFGWGLVAVIEDVHAIFGSSAKSTFNFGWIKGLLQGLLVGNGIPYSLVSPKEWQKEMWTRQDKVVKDNRVQPKPTSINAASRLFPNVDLRRTPKCKKPDDNKADSILLAEYARRRNL